MLVAVGTAKHNSRSERRCLPLPPTTLTQRLDKHATSRQVVLRLGVGARTREEGVEVDAAIGVHRLA